MNFVDYLRQLQAEQNNQGGVIPMMPRRPSMSQRASMDVSQGMMPQAVMPIERPRAAPMMMGQPQAVAAMPTGGFVQGREAFGPAMPAEYQVAGYSKGLANAGPGAQAYADQFAGGDLSKVRSRLINIDGQMVNDFYTRGLLDAPVPQGPVAPDASTGGYGPPQPGLLDRFGGWLGGMFGGGQ